jgi:hypothetical protein
MADDHMAGDLQSHGRWSHGRYDGHMAGHMAGQIANN